VGKKNPFDISRMKNRIFGLDLLRCIAILTVLIDHGVVFSQQFLPQLNWVLLFDGVDVFFVFSGFLIGKILIRQIIVRPSFSGAALLNFWQRRWFRTLSAYYFVLGASVASSSLNKLVAGKPYTLTIKTWLPYVFFLQNIHKPQSSFFGVSWSLAVEEWFYLFVPLFLFAIYHSAARYLHINDRVIICLLVAIILIPFLRYIHYEHVSTTLISEWDSHIRKVVIYRFDSLLYGCIGAYFQYAYQKVWERYKYSLFVTGIILLISLYSYALSMNPVMVSLFFYVFFFSINGLGIVCLFPVLSSYNPYISNRLTQKIVAAIHFINLVSYSIYLLHEFIILTYLKKIFDRFTFTFLSVEAVNMAFFAAYISFSVAGAWLMYQFIEKPFIRLRPQEI
jgi:peptidoglycan/LPS O-acetylase OafA/YrhL